jgi:hypothetical protein
LSGCALGFNKFEEAYKACDEPSGISVSDGGKTLSIDTRGNDDYSGAAYSDMTCILDELKVPQYIRDDIDATNSLMGRQSADYDGISMTWSYHPDSGAKMTFHYGD